MAYLDVESVPDVDVELVGELGDLGDVVEPLDIKEESEKLLLGDRIEWKQTSFLCSLIKRGGAVAATDKAGNSALQSRRCFFSSLAPLPSSALRWVTLSL